MRRLLACVALSVVAAGCGSVDGPNAGMTEGPPAAQALTTTTVSSLVPRPGPGHSGPPPIRVRGQGRELALFPSSSCWRTPTGGVCADGRPPESPPDIGVPVALEVEFDVPDWRLTATTALTGQACGREQTVELPVSGPTTHRLVPIGPAGDYTVTLRGRSTAWAAQRGDVSTVFRWRTSHGGPNEAPTATASIIAGRSWEPTSYGVEVSARALGTASRGGTVRGSVIVTSGDGTSMSIDLQPRSFERCIPDGVLHLGATQELGKKAAAMGPAPFRYDVTLVLDSITYRGAGTWPDDQMAECSPCTSLRFTPPLPSL